MTTLDLLRLEQVWRTLSADDRQRLFEMLPELYSAIELWLVARQ